MADSNKKRSENVAGRFFVDDQCISCGACWREAPDFFKSHEVHTFAYVQRQPQTEAEVRACNTALNICPVEAIGMTEDSSLSNLQPEKRNLL